MITTYPILEASDDHWCACANCHDAAPAFVAKEGYWLIRTYRTGVPGPPAKLVFCSQDCRQLFETRNNILPIPISQNRLDLEQRASGYRNCQFNIALREKCKSMAQEKLRATI